MKSTLLRKFIHFCGINLFRGHDRDRDWDHGSDHYSDRDMNHNRERYNDPTFTATLDLCTNKLSCAIRGK